MAAYCQMVLSPCIGAGLRKTQKADEKFQTEECRGKEKALKINAHQEGALPCHSAGSVGSTQEAFHRV